MIKFFIFKILRNLLAIFGVISLLILGYIYYKDFQRQREFQQEIEINEARNWEVTLESSEYLKIFDPTTDSSLDKNTEPMSFSVSYSNQEIPTSYANLII